MSEDQKQRFEELKAKGYRSLVGEERAEYKELKALFEGEAPAEEEEIAALTEDTEEKEEAPVALPQFPLAFVEGHKVLDTTFDGQYYRLRAANGCTYVLGVAEYQLKLERDNRPL